jgi:hypothetical protein
MSNINDLIREWNEAARSGDYSIKYPTYIRDNDICKSLPELERQNAVLSEWKEKFEAFVNDTNNNENDIKKAQIELKHINKALGSVTAYLAKGTSGSCSIMGGRRRKTGRRRLRRSRRMSRSRRLRRTRRMRR